MSKSALNIKTIFPSWRINSLKIRLMLSALLMIVVMLPIIGFTLNNAFDKQLKSAISNELRAYSYSIFSVAEVENNQLIMPEQLLENQFNVIQSGLYAQINHKTNLLNLANDKPNTLWRSRSLIGLTLPTKLSSPEMGQSSFSEVLIENKAHLVYSFSANFNNDGQSFPITLQIFKDQTEFLSVASEFKQQLWTWLILLMLVFIAVQFIWLMWTLKPLSKLAIELASIEKGQKNALKEVYPVELEQVTMQLNVLLATEQNQRRRYRNALSDLAHSLKNPLAVMQSQTDLSASSVEQLTHISRMIEHQLKRAQSAGESSWHLGFLVKNTAEKLIKTLAKIYKDKELTFTTEISKTALFKGDETDLMEILGNVLDNACKAAKNNVSLVVKGNENKLTIVIEDDGVGIKISQQQTILSRGTRSDTYQKGHGIGLAIVRDLVASYQGELRIEKSPKLKGAMFTLVFQHQLKQK